MDNKYLCEVLEDASKEQIIDFLLKVIEIIPDSENNEVMKLINETFKNEIQNNDLIDLDKKIEEIKEQFDLINNEELVFHSETYETGDYAWDDGYETSYYDSDNVGSVIEDAYNLAFILVTKKDYKYAKIIFDLILFTTYYVIEDDYSDVLDYDISDIIYHNLVDIDLNKVCLTVLYITLLISDNKYEEIYKYYDKRIFDNINIEDVFKMEYEPLIDLSLFWNEWIKYLSKKDTKISYDLLKHALVYNNYDNYREILKLNKITHPQVYLLVFDNLLKEKKYEEIIEIGKEVMEEFDNNIKSQISLLVAESYKKINPNYDISDYLYKSFEFEHKIVNLIRIINNDYLEKYKKEILLVKENSENDKDILLFNYFLGDFDSFFNSFKDIKEYLGWTYSSMNICVELLLFLICNDRSSNVKKRLVNSISFDLGINDDKYNLFNADLRGVDNFEILNTWKNHFDISNDKKLEYANWLEVTISKRVDAIVSNKFQSSYCKAAFLVCVLDECLENLGVKSKGEIISFYEQKYHRYIAFKREINSYKA